MKMTAIECLSLPTSLKFIKNVSSMPNSKYPQSSRAPNLPVFLANPEITTQKGPKRSLSQHDRNTRKQQTRNESSMNFYDNSD